MLTVRLFRPFSMAGFVAALPSSVRAIAVLDRTKEPGALGEPLYQDVITALSEAQADGRSIFAAEPVVVGGRYGLASRNSRPAWSGRYSIICASQAEEPLHGRYHGRVTRTSIPFDARNLLRSV